MVCLCGQRGSVLREDRVKEAGAENWDLGSPVLDEFLLTSLCLSHIYGMVKLVTLIL